MLGVLSEMFDENTSVFFQPCFNGDRPDVVLLNKDRGVVVVEVKDWDLDNYTISSDNKWSLKSNGHIIKSPFEQVFSYKKNFFDVHVNGLLEKLVRDDRFFNIINVNVYFHCATKKRLEAFYSPAIIEVGKQLRENDAVFKAGRVAHEDYDSRREYLERKKKNLLRDLNMLSITNDNLNKISFSKNLKGIDFHETVYDEFYRLLFPPYHYANEGKELSYSKLQARLSESLEGSRAKICGVAGSGKTTVLAKRAVNAHKRHEGAVLILTFNITLRMYIKGKISEVREGFSWGSFEIAHYHGFMSDAFNNYGVDVNFKGLDWEQLEARYFSNKNIFDQVEVQHKYATILVDEVQDYKSEWLKIIRDNFLAPQGEMVLFGDEKQNIYSRAIDADRRSKLIEGFGRWEKLNKSFRYKQDSHIMKVAALFQEGFLQENYDVDIDESYQPSLTMLGVNAYSTYHENDLENCVSLVVKLTKSERLHPNDVTIVCSKESVLQYLDYHLRHSNEHKQRTLTTFATLEMTQHPKFKKSNKAIGNAKKIGFNLNSGVTKLSTIHSFKGYESPLVVLFVCDKDSAEMIYTGLTRAKESVVVFLPEDSIYRDFFEKNLDRLSGILSDGKV
ncbi:nuclease-related domain-containing DEAD/DEAH box helicase [Pseudomonas aeruginosa]|uniref:nuclease-related domain-containing DEAD/DEAH box helicase n=1 Tax=Pseudomonas aeruginosa TaxID=287 RepID=UPI002148F957|nr:NERD domain-containing protein/DEAD/DEAH box helicase [Pseudomonas aeruginosa]MCQ9875737.1 AAA family ATPase [Pseudomonas aeruginosa]HEJ1948277.1 AAA family ATPase [Pseudomonas aeruginosa]